MLPHLFLIQVAKLMYILYGILKAFVSSTVGAKIHRNRLEKIAENWGGDECLPPCVPPDSVSKLSLTLLIGCWCAGDLKGDLLFFSLQYFERGDFLGDRFARVRMYSATLGLRWLTSTLDGDCSINGQYKENKPIVNYRKTGFNCENLIIVNCEFF